MSKIKHAFNRLRHGVTTKGYRVIIETEVLVNATNKVHAKNQVRDLRDSIKFAVDKHEIPSREVRVRVKSL